MCKLTSSLGKSLQWYVDNGWLPAIPKEGEVPANLEDCSWNMIHQLVQADTFKNYYKVGDTKSVTLSTGEVVYMQVASINDGNGNAGAWYPKGTVDFISRDCLETKYQMSADNISNWSSCDIRKTLNQTIINNLPIDLSNVIIEKTHIYYVYNNNYIDASDKLWIPTRYEIAGANSADSNDKVDANIKYPIFTDDSSHIKAQGNTGNITNWWASSSYNKNNNYFTLVTTNGGLGWYNATGVNCIPLCFRVG